ncbi:MAG: alkaline phosphatase family protein [Acidobacteriota bacterium]
MSNMQSNIKHVVHLMLENRSFDSLLGWLRWDDQDRPKNHVPALRPNEKEFYGLDGTEWLPSNFTYFLREGPFTYKREKITKITPGSAWDYCEMPASDPGEEFEHVKAQLKAAPYATLKPMGYYLDYLTVYDFGSASDILGVFVPDTLPCLNTLAARFAASDMWFSSVPTQTNPNRAFSLCGTSLGRINNNADLNTYKLCGQSYGNINNIFSVFNAFNTNNPSQPPITWKLYSRWNWHDVARDPAHPFEKGWHSWHKGKEAGALCFDATKGKYFTPYMFPKGFDNKQWGAIGTVHDFKKDVSENTLPDFSYIEPAFFPQTLDPNDLTDYHPPESVYAGEGFVKEIFHTLTSHPQVWANTLFIITFDEHGGTYDHLMPPKNAVPPDTNTNPDFDFKRYGVRIPTLLISPWVTPGTIFRAGYYPEVADKTQLPFDHTSVLASLCKWKGINYQNKQQFPDYYLGDRTAVAPTFDTVITNTSDTSTPKLMQHNCSAGLTGVVKRRELLRSMTRGVAEITGQSEADVAQQGIVEEILISCKNAAELEAYFRDLAAQHGKK